MINIIFFSKYREVFGAESLPFELSLSSVNNDKQNVSCGMIMESLQQRFPEKTGFLEDKNLLIAINQAFAQRADIVHEGDELAFFPPVTGG